MPAQSVLIDQLQIGMFIHLELKWSEHPFFFNSFKIKNADQIETLRGLGLREVLYFPEKSDCPPAPLPPPQVQAIHPPPDQPVQACDGLLQLKAQQIERLRHRREQIQYCEKQYQQTVSQVKTVMQNLSTGSAEATEQADDLVQGIVGNLSADREAVVHLVNVKTKDETAFYHSLNVAILALVLAKEHGLDAEQMRLLGLGALLHDIGKQKIPKNLLYKRTPLSTAEKKLWQLHPRYGVEMMSTHAEFPREALQIIHQHHETNDGKGYPEGLQGDDISLLTKVTAIADRYDNLCNKIDPEESLTPYETLSYMFCRKQQQFDPVLLSLFIGCMGVYPPGTVVQLSNGIIGMVVSINSSNPLHPSILIYDPSVPKSEAVIFDLEGDAELKIERSLRPSQLPPEIYAYLDPRVRVTYFLETHEGGHLPKVSG
jgi:putative nucleotidyltransferase with HDIG domain